MESASCTSRCTSHGDLLLAGERVSDIHALLRECRQAVGQTGVRSSADRWREAELRQALEAVDFPGV